MRLLFNIDGLYNSGGMERVLTEKVNFFKREYGYDIIIITTEGKGKSSFFSLEKEVKVIELGINYSNIQTKKNIFMRKISTFFKKRKHLFKVKKIVKQYKPDIIISLGDNSSIIGELKNNNIAKVLEIHFEKSKYLNITNNKNGVLGKLIYKYKKLKTIKMIRNYDEFIVLTKDDKKEWLKDIKIQNIREIPNPLPFVSDKISKQENKVIISVGRLEEVKDYYTLIKVWEKLFRKYPDWKLEIYGEGSLRGKLQEKINTLGMETSLILKGTEKNIKDKYLESSIYIMTSKHEGFGMVLMEAMICGLPVIAFDSSCGPKEIITEEEDGFLIRNRDLDEMANKLEMLILDKEKRKKMGKKAHDNIKRYSKSKVMLQWKRLFEKIIKGKNENEKRSYM